LARQTRGRGVEVTLVNAATHFVERPRLHQVAAGQQVADLPLRDLLAPTGARLIVAGATGIDLRRREVALRTPDGRDGVAGYDTLVYALGSVIDLDRVPGVRAHAHALSDPAAAHRLGRDLRAQAARRGTLVVCGTGLTGIESAAELAEAHPGLRVRLLGSHDPGAVLAPAGARHLRAGLDRLGVEVLPGARITAVRAQALTLADGREVVFDTCLWAGGFTVPTLARAAGLAVDGRGRVLVDGALRSRSHPEVCAIGDAAAAAGPWGDAIAYGCRTGAFMAPYAADAIADTLARRSPRRFGFRYIHQCISLGRHDAVVQFVHPRDEHPLRAVLTGRAALRYKELTLRGAVWTFRHPGPYLARRRASGRAPADAHREANGHAR
ncbi:MAG TPA: FAD-dependent oxidoreductase, partial [Euzebyales bacterium]|nr:FAD-dependent oxidoreductase [Euzebyales bacterium]